ncbi:MAG: hypothetical protein LBE82_08025 [Chitinophagaceae bacterium]|nr:hypothetical protein [Chitinophagaceae bacterium]
MAFPDDGFWMRDAMRGVLLHTTRVFKPEIDEDEYIELPNDVKAKLDQIAEDYDNGEKFYDWEELHAHTQEFLTSLRTKK